MARTLGLGAVVKMDEDDNGSVFTSVTLVTTATPPKRKRIRVSGIALSDTLESDDMGIEAKDDVTMTIMYEPHDTQHAAFDTMYNAKTQLIWNITYASADVETFEGILSDIEPGPIVHDQYLTMNIIIHRKTASSWA